MVTYEEMNNLADRLASALLAHGLQKGDRVGLALPNLPQFVMAFYGILKAGGVVVAINPQYKQPELVYQIADSGAEILFGLGSAYDLLRAVQKDTALRTLILNEPGRWPGIARLVFRQAGSIPISFSARRRGCVAG